MSLLDFKPDEVELMSMSIAFILFAPISTDGSILENQGFVRIRHLCLGEGANNHKTIIISLWWLVFKLHLHSIVLYACIVKRLCTSGLILLLVAVATICLDTISWPLLFCVSDDSVSTSLVAPLEYGKWRRAISQDIDSRRRWLGVTDAESSCCDDSSILLRPYLDRLGSMIGLTPRGK